MFTRCAISILLIFLSVHIQDGARASERDLKVVNGGGLNADAPDFVPSINALGPLRIRSLSPANSLRLSAIPRSPYGLPKGQTETQFNVAIANIGIKKTEYILDFEFSDTRLAVQHGLADNWSAELSFNERRIISAHLDRLRHNFHDLFNLDESDLPFNDTKISIPALGIDLDKDIRGVYSQTIEISVQKVLQNEDDTRPAFAVNVNMSYETHGSDLVDVYTLDYGIQFSVAKKRSNGYAYGNLGLTYFGSEESLDIQLKQRQFTGMMAYEFTFENARALLLQYIFSEGVVENVNVLDEFTHEIHIGYKWRTQSYLWELGLVENIINPDNTSDFAFTFGLAYQF